MFYAVNNSAAILIRGASIRIYIALAFELKLELDFDIAMFQMKFDLIDHESL